VGSCCYILSDLFYCVALLARRSELFHNSSLGGNLRCLVFRISRMVYMLVSNSFELILFSFTMKSGPLTLLFCSENKLHSKRPLFTRYRFLMIQMNSKLLKKKVMHLLIFFRYTHYFCSGNDNNDFQYFTL
jgi:hypothetical protein